MAGDSKPIAYTKKITKMAISRALIENGRINQVRVLGEVSTKKGMFTSIPKIVVNTLAPLAPCGCTSISRCGRGGSAPIQGTTAPAPFVVGECARWYMGGCACRWWWVNGSVGGG